jgi:hypothetical protein
MGKEEGSFPDCHGLGVTHSWLNKFGMKKALIIIGIVVLTVVVGFFAFLGFLSYTYHSMRQRAQLAAQQEMEQHESSLVNGPNTILDAVKTQAPVVVDPEGYQTEDNWLAATICREIAEMAFVAAHPDQTLPDIKIQAQVDPDKPAIHVEVSGFEQGNDATVVSDLTPVFAWDAHGYAPLARRFLGNVATAPPEPASDATDILSHLLSLTGSELALEDVRVSTDLQQKPSSPEIHEQAALLLTALALRENAGIYSDNRILLSRATAHLALAEALRGNQPATWPGLVAEGAIRTLSGRELDALGYLDGLDARGDGPPSAKSWIAALRVVAKQDWRAADVNAASPLLLKIAWFQVIARDLSGIVATHHLDEIVPEPEAKPNATTEPPPNPQLDLPDWGRALVATEYDFSEENGSRFLAANGPRELSELAETLKIEGDPAADAENLAGAFAEPEHGTVSRDANGKLTVRVIGPAAFKYSVRRHLFQNLSAIRGLAMEMESGKTEIEAYLSRMDVRFRGVSQYELTHSTGDAAQTQVMVDRMHAAKQTWRVWEIPPLPDCYHLPGGDLLNSFYSRAVPFGTAYRPEERVAIMDRLASTEVNKYAKRAQKEYRDMMASMPAGPKRDAAAQAWLADQNAHPERVMLRDRSPVAKELLKLAPDDYTLATDEIPPEQLLTVAAPFLDYNMRALLRIQKVEDRMPLPEAQYEAVYRRQVALDPDLYFGLAYLLFQQGREDEAAAMDRLGYAQAYDVVYMSNAADNLVEYDVTHGLSDEAKTVAQRAADVGSVGGMRTQMRYLESVNQLEPAEKLGQQIMESYGNERPLHAFYVRHRDQYPAQYRVEVTRTFPDGLKKADLASFTGKPKSGCQIKSDTAVLRKAQLQKEDVIVALDGYAVNSAAQYGFIWNFTRDPAMDFIIWRDDHYLEIKASVPHRDFYVSMDNYFGTP